jgi:hypothetical protein
LCTRSWRNCSESIDAVVLAAVEELVEPGLDVVFLLDPVSLHPLRDVGGAPALDQGPNVVAVDEGGVRRIARRQQSGDPFEGVARAGVGDSTFNLSCLAWKASTTLFSIESENALPQAM